MLVRTIAAASMALLVAYSAEPADSPPRNFTLGGSEQIEIPITVSAQPQLLLVRQFSVDVVVQCADGIARNAPQGRIGLEAVVLDVSSRCAISPKMPQAKPGNIAVSIHDLDHPVMGARQQLWRDYARVLELNDEQADARAEALRLLLPLTVTPGLSNELSLMLILARANLQRRNGEHELAIAAYARAAEQASRRPEILVAIRNGEGLSHFSLRQIPQARAAFNEALAIAAKIGAGYDGAAAQNNLCLLLQFEDQLSEAATCYQQAAQMFTQAGELDHRTVALSNWGFWAQRSGDPDGALRAFTEVLALRRAGPQRRALALTMLKLSSLHSQLADWQPALSMAREAMDLLGELADPTDIAGAQRAYAAVLGQLGQVERAISYLRLAEANAGDKPSALAGILTDHAALLGRGPEAAELRKNALVLYRQQQDLANGVSLEIELARDELAADRITEAKLRLDELMERIPATDLARQARFALARAELALASGAAEATDVFEVPIRTFAQLHDQEGVMDATLLAARWHLSAGRPAQARSVLLSAASGHARALQTAPSPALAASYVAQHRTWKDLLLRSGTDDPTKPWDWSELWEALARFATLPTFETNGSQQDWQRFRMLSALLGEQRELSTSMREALRLSGARQSSWLRELDVLDQRLQRAHQQPVAATLAQWQAALAADDVLVRYVVGARSSLALWVRKDNVEAIHLPGREALRQAIAEARTDATAALQLSHLLLPFEQVRGLGGRLLVTPDEDLFATPFAALALTQPQWKTPVVVVSGPGVPNFQLLQRLPIAYSVNSLDLPALDPLPGPKRTRLYLAGSLGDRLKTVTLGANALPDADVIHIAGHGWFHADFPGANALSGDAPGTADAQTFAVGDLRFAASPRLIVLNACEVAGADRYGAGLSLARSFAETHGTLVLGPTEPVDDGVAMSFDLAFFKALEQQSADQALLSALRALPVDRRLVLPPWQLVLSGHIAVGESSASAQ